jgi:hypothetical protein
MLNAPQAGTEKALVLVKALPHVGDRYGETVCCAGVTPDGEWRRQYPIRYRRLQSGFRRWDWIQYSWRKPTNDPRKESRRVQEDSIRVLGTMPRTQRNFLLGRILLPTMKAAEAREQTLALVRPEIPEFFVKRKPDAQIENERAAFQRAASQGSLFDADLKALEPVPYIFGYRYRLEDGEHIHTCEDWETSATFWRHSKTDGDEAARVAVERIFGRDYPAKGMLFAMGTHSRRRQWLLVGVIRSEAADQPDLFAS